MHRNASPKNLPNIKPLIPISYYDIRVNCELCKTPVDASIASNLSPAHPECLNIYDIRQASGICICCGKNPQGKNTLVVMFHCEECKKNPTPAGYPHQ